MLRTIQTYFDKILVFLVLVLGLWLVVIHPLGPGLSLLPGDEGDTRLNIYLLEHFPRWIGGLDESFWTAPFAYPYHFTVAFSDNHLGSGIFYSLFRWVGLDRETAFQGWYITGYLLNFLAVVYVERKMGFRSLAIGAGAFFFTFGLPVLAQEYHVQLFYRFGVPLACFFLWKFQDTSKLRYLAVAVFWTIYQFYLSIYIGVFLTLLIMVIVVLFPFIYQSISFREIVIFWPKKIAGAWKVAANSERIIVLIATIFLGVGLFFLLLPYYKVTIIYGFSRSWEYITTMLPTWKSFLLADGSLFWANVSSQIVDITRRWEHQLFPGISVVVLSIIGLFFRNNTRIRKFVVIHFLAAIIMLLITFSWNGHSLYEIFGRLPGLNAIRAVTRVMLVLCWPIGLIISAGVEKLMQFNCPRGSWLKLSAFVLTGFLIAESIFFFHNTFDKRTSQNRVEKLREQIPAVVPQDPILIVSSGSGNQWHLFEIDGMLLAQELGWPTMNVYTGNLPPGYRQMEGCISVPERILAYIDFMNISSESYYFDLMSRVVPIGFDDCDPNWWVQKP